MNLTTKLIIFFLLAILAHCALAKTIDSPPATRPVTGQIALIPLGNGGQLLCVLRSATVADCQFINPDFYQRCALVDGVVRCGN